VNWFLRIVAVTLLALWVPATMHCTLETTPGFSFLQSCCGADEAPPLDQDCAQDLCSVVESGLYKIEDPSTFAPSLVVLLTFAALDWMAEPPAASVPDFFPASTAPPDLPKVWQFSQRTALPPRAPSLDA